MLYIMNYIFVFQLDQL